MLRPSPPQGFTFIPALERAGFSAKEDEALRPEGRSFHSSFERNLSEAENPVMLRPSPPQGFTFIPALERAGFSAKEDEALLAIYYDIMIIGISSITIFPAFPAGLLRLF
jgi:hypothetical protein